MLSVLSDASLIITWTLAPLHLLCILGVFLLRKRPIYVIRIPELMLGLMIFKFFGFALCALMLLDGTCPCIVFTLAHLCDNAGNYFQSLRNLVVLLRFELQAALNHVKQGESAATLDEKNIFVRYRFLLRAKWQFVLMAGMFAALAVPKLILVLTLLDELDRPCITDRLDANSFVLWNMILVLVEFWPVSIANGLIMHKLKRFPGDNWKMGSEWTINAGLGSCQLVAMIFTLSFQPFLDKYVFLLFIFSIFHQLCSFFIPLKFHRDRVKQFAHADLKMSSLSRLLQDSTFVEAFHAFLTKEFSSENLFFWLEAHRIQYKYMMLLPDEMADVTSSSTSGSAGASLPRADSSKKDSSKKDSSKKDHSKRRDEADAKLIAAAANECLYLGQQCIGDAAPWQINISGDVDSAMAASIGQLAEFFKTDVNDEQIHSELKPLVEDALRWMMKAQFEIYECLRKDPYPRFVQSPAFAELNKNQHFKMGLAAEIIDEEARDRTAEGPPSTSHRSRKTTGSPSSTSRKSEPKAIQMVETNRSSFVTLGTTTWNKQLTQMRKGAQPLEPVHTEHSAVSDDETFAASSNMMIESMRASSSNPLEEAITIAPILPPSPSHSLGVSRSGPRQSDIRSSSQSLDDAT